MVSTQRPPCSSSARMLAQPAAPAAESALYQAAHHMHVAMQRGPTLPAYLRVGPALRLPPSSSPCTQGWLCPAEPPSAAALAADPLSPQHTTHDLGRQSSIKKGSSGWYWSVTAARHLLLSGQNRTTAVVEPNMHNAGTYMAVTAAVIRTTHHNVPSPALLCNDWHAPLSPPHNCAPAAALGLPKRHKEGPGIGHVLLLFSPCAC